MTAAYAPEVAAARERLEEDCRNHQFFAVCEDDLCRLLADHARLAEEAVKLRRVAKAAKETLDNVCCLCSEGVEFMGKLSLVSAIEKDMKQLSAALAALEVKNG